MKTMLALALVLAGCAPGGRASLPAGRGPDPTWPRAMVLPQPDGQFSFQVDGREWLRYHTGAQSPKPYFYPVLGPAGWPVTRLTHPRDPHTHDHHLSLWIGHEKVGPANFWEARRSRARIVHDHVVRIDDGEKAVLTVRAKWLGEDQQVLLLDERVWTLAPRLETIGPNGFGEFTLDLDLKLAPAAPAITIGKSNFGMLAVRVAKMMGTIDGGGTITNSEGQVDEKELMNPHKRARWCDTSGRAAPGEPNGISFFDHPRNPDHPAHFHVRGDGWMGASLTYDADLVIAKEKPLVLRYRFWVHRGVAEPKAIDAEWRRWARGS